MSHVFRDWAKELEEADARTKAAALRLSGGYPDEAKYNVTEAKSAIEASDEVLFSAEAIERAARAEHDEDWRGDVEWEDHEEYVRDNYRRGIRIIIAALKGES